MLTKLTATYERGAKHTKHTHKAHTNTHTKHTQTHTQSTHIKHTHKAHKRSTHIKHTHKGHTQSTHTNYKPQVQSQKALRARTTETLPPQHTVKHEDPTETFDDEFYR